MRRRRDDGEPLEALAQQALHQNREHAENEDQEEETAQVADIDPETL